LDCNRYNSNLLYLLLLNMVSIIDGNLRIRRGWWNGLLIWWFDEL